MKKRILIVDDAPIMRLMIKDIITPLGYEVAGEAGNGKEAVSMFKKEKPDLVTMDITMPDMDGIEALELILNENPDAKVIMVTAIDQKESLRKAIKLGALDYIVKPFENDRVISAIKKALGDQ